MAPAQTTTAPAAVGSNGHVKPQQGSAMRRAAEDSQIRYQPLGDALPYRKLTDEQLREKAGNLLRTLEDQHAEMRLRLVTISHDFPVYVTGNTEQGQRQRLLKDATEVRNIRGEQIAIVRAQMTAAEAQIRALYAHPYWGLLLEPVIDTAPDDGMEIVETAVEPEAGDVGDVGSNSEPEGAG